MTLDNPLRIGKLKPHAADKVEIGRLVASTGRALTDAGLEGLSSDARLDLAYRVIVNEIRVWLAAHHPNMMQADA